MVLCCEPLSKCKTESVPFVFVLCSNTKQPVTRTKSLKNLKNLRSRRRLKIDKRADQGRKSDGLCAGGTFG